MAGTVGTAYVDVELDPTGIRRGLNKVQSDVKQGFDRVSDQASGQMKSAGEKSGRSFRDGFSSSVKTMGPAVKKAFLPALAGLGAVAVFGKKAIDAASDLSEQVNKTGVVFKASSKDILAWSQDAAKGFGMSRREALESAGVFGNMLVPMGVARTEAAGMSKRFVQLGADLASFNNASPEETLDAIRAGLAGETEPLRRFGVFLNQARIAQEAMNMGLVAGAAAYKAAGDAVKTATKGVTDAQRERARAAAEVESATKRLATAEKAIQTSADAVAASQERVRDATRRLSDTEYTATTATQKLRDAKRALTAAQANARSMQEALTEARKKATQQLLDLRDASTDAALGEERAGLALERAQQRLAETGKDAEATDLDRREAMLAVKEAERGVQEAQERRQQSTEELADAERRGVEGSQLVIDARRDIAEADQRTIKAARAVAAAQHGLAAAQASVRDALRGVAAAQDDLRTKQVAAREATEGYRTAQQDLRAAQVQSVQASKNVATAERTLATAKQRLNKLSKNTAASMTAEQKAMATASIILKDTKDAHGDFARTSKGVANQQRILKAQIEDTSAAVGKDLLPATQKMNEALISVFSMMGKYPKTTLALVGAFTALSGAIVIANAALKIYENWATIVKVATRVWAAVNWVLTASFYAIPILLIVAGIIALIAVFVLAYKKVDWFRKAVDAAFAAIVDGAKWVLDFFKNNWQYVIAGMIFGPFGLAVVFIIKHWDDIKEAVTKGATAVLDFLTGMVPKVGDAAKDLGNAIKDGIVGAVTGLASAVWGVLLRVGELIGRKLGEVAGWGADVGNRLKDAIVAGIVGVGNAVWGIVNNVWTVLSSYLVTIKSWGTSVGTWIKDALTDAVRGVGGAVYGVLQAGWAYLQEQAKDIGAWGKEIGTWLKNGIVDGLRGLGKLIRDLLRKALGKLGKAGSVVEKGLGLIPGRNIAYVPGVAEAQGAAVQAGLRGGGEAGGGLAGPAPPLYQFKQALADLQRPQPEQHVMVRVFIGDQELRGIVRTEAVRIDNATARLLLAGATGAT